ncbi:DUF2169 domain-containing protein [Massilia frigida]
MRLHCDHLGKSHVLVIAKGTWSLSTGRMASAERQVSLYEYPVNIRLGDLKLDQSQKEAMRSRLDEEIVWLGYDLSPPKPAFDVIVAGYVTAPTSCSEMFIDAGIRVGTRTASIRAHVPRFWQSRWIGYKATPLATSVRRVPITYAVADWAQGFNIDPDQDKSSPLPKYLPWIESLNASANHRRHSRAPAGFGCWPESATHRQAYLGTFGKTWKKDGSPDLPRDFNPRFYNVAHPDLQLPEVPASGTEIRLVHLAEKSIIDFAFPFLSLAVQARTGAGHELTPTSLRPDTLTIEPDEDRLSIVWRVLIPTGTGDSAIRIVRLFKPPVSIR